MQVGPEGLARFLAALAVEADAALRISVDTETWGQFTKAFLDGAIQSPGGRAVPRAAKITGVLDVDRSQGLNLDVTPSSSGGISFASTRKSISSFGLAGQTGCKCACRTRAKAGRNCYFSSPPAQTR